jgi:hypothetical protein
MGKTKDKRHRKKYTQQTNSAEKRKKKNEGNSHWIYHIHEGFRYFINVTRPIAAKAAPPTAIYGHQLLLVLLL